MTTSQQRTVSSQTDRPRSREDRSRRTHALLTEAHGCEDQDRRKALLDEVVLLNRGVAEAVAARYRNRGVALEDLEQAAYEGLVKAVHKFDPTVRPDLLTYAVPTIRGEVQRWFRDHGWTVRPPRSIQELQWKIKRSVEHLSAELGRQPSNEEISTDLDSTPEQVSAALQAFGSFQPTSLDRLVGQGDGTTLGDILTADDRDHDAAEARAALSPALRVLPERDRRILYLRFFEERSQSEIGDELGITQMQVSRLLNRILRDLRRRMGDEALPLAS